MKCLREFTVGSDSGLKLLRFIAAPSALVRQRYALSHRAILNPIATQTSPHARS